MLYQSTEVTAKTVMVQAFVLSANLINKISGDKPLVVESLPLAASSQVRARAKVMNGFFYIGSGTLESPQLGDLQVRFNVIEPTTVSVVARQAQNRLEAYQTQAGDTIDLLAMVQSARMRCLKQRNRRILFLHGCCASVDL